jgi:hypothetical protein
VVCGLVEFVRRSIEGIEGLSLGEFLELKVSGTKLLSSNAWHAKLGFSSFLQRRFGHCRSRVEGVLGGSRDW